MVSHSGYIRTGVTDPWAVCHERPSPNPLQQCRPIVPRSGHLLADGPDFQHIIVRRWEQCGRIATKLAQPCLPILRCEDDWHPVVYLRHHRIGIRGDDGEPACHRAIRPFEAFP